MTLYLKWWFKKIISSPTSRWTVSGGRTDFRELMRLFCNNTRSEEQERQGGVWSSVCEATLFVWLRVCWLPLQDAATSYSSDCWLAAIQSEQRTHTLRDTDTQKNILFSLRGWNLPSSSYLKKHTVSPARRWCNQNKMATEEEEAADNSVYVSVT